MAARHHHAAARGAPLGEHELQGLEDARELHLHVDGPAAPDPGAVGGAREGPVGPVALGPRHAGDHVLVGHEHDGVETRVAAGQLQQQGLGAAAGRALHEGLGGRREDAGVARPQVGALPLEGAPVVRGVGLRGHGGKREEPGQAPGRRRAVEPGAAVAGEEREDAVAARRRRSVGTHGHSGWRSTAPSHSSWRSVSERSARAPLMAASMSPLPLATPTPVVTTSGKPSPSANRTATMPGLLRR